MTQTSARTVVNEWAQCWRENRLLRPRAGRKIAGVCAGFAEYFDLDVTLVRLVWLIVGICTGVGLLAYPIAWIIMPEEPAALPLPDGQHATNP